MTAYYNEIDPHAAQWLRNLIAEGVIAPGDVDERDIRDVLPSDIARYTQCHFFAGVGVWSYALRLAGWPDSRPVDTASCPCQPFSAAGRGDGFADERHLWPALHWLVGQRRPLVLFGEQVASKDADAWIDLVQADVEGMDYAFGCVPFPSAGIGAPHIRERTYWVADAATGGQREHGRAPRQSGHLALGVATGGLADADGGDACAKRQQRGREHGQQPLDGGPGRTPPAGPTNGRWRNADWLLCRDDKWRPVEPGTFPLAHGATARVGRLRAYGNAINAEAAAEFVRTYREARGEDVAGDAALELAALLA